MNLLADERPCWRVTRHEDGTARFIPRYGARRIANHISGSGGDAYSGARGRPLRPPNNLKLESSRRFLF